MPTIPSPEGGSREPAPEEQGPRGKVELAGEVTVAMAAGSDARRHVTRGCHGAGPWRRGRPASRSDVRQAPPLFPAPLPPPPPPAPRGPGGFTAQQDGGGGGERSWRGCRGRSGGSRAGGPPAASARPGAPGRPRCRAPGGWPAASPSPGLPRAGACPHRLLRDRPHHRQGQLRCGQAGHAPRHQGQGSGAAGADGCGAAQPGTVRPSVAGAGETRDGEAEGSARRAGLGIVKSVGDRGHGRGGGCRRGVRRGRAEGRGVRGAGRGKLRGQGGHGGPWSAETWGTKEPGMGRGCSAGALRRVVEGVIGKKRFGTLTEPKTVS